MDDRAEEDQEGGEEKGQEVTRYPWADTEVLFTWKALCARTRVVWQAIRRI